MAIGTELGRPADSKNRIVNEFRQRIVSGELGPGCRIPTRSEIGAQYGAGPMTVQRALDALQQEGFIRVQGRQGTFVADNPPHLSRYAFVFPLPSSDYTQRNLWTALKLEIDFGLPQSSQRQLVAYYGVNGHEDSEDYIRLVREVQNRQLAGLIFMTHPFELRGTPLWEEAGIARVAIMDPFDVPFPVVTLDTNSFLSRAFEYLQAQGRKNVAVLKPVYYDWDESLFEKCGLRSHRFWQIDINLDTPQNARNCANLLMQCRERPDALVVCDDNLLESATLGLIDAGVKVPDDIEVVSHCNFPYPTGSWIPVQRVGFDVRQLIETCVDNINQQTLGLPPPPVTRLPAHFEAEIQQSGVHLPRPCQN